MKNTKIFPRYRRNKPTKFYLADGRRYFPKNTPVMA